MELKCPGKTEFTLLIDHFFPGYLNFGKPTQNHETQVIDLVEELLKVTK